MTPSNDSEGAAPARSATWKFKLGATTFWNADREDVVAPVIDPHPPALTELDGAVVTPRRITPKVDGERGDRLRYASGAVYDRDHDILPIFAEREAFEAQADTRNRLRNPPRLPEAELVGAQVLRGRYIYLGLLRPHFGHFLLESLSRMWALLVAEPDVKIIVHGNPSMERLPSYIHHIFKLLELDPSRIVPATRTLVVEHLIFPQSEFEIRWQGKASYADLFHELFERNSFYFPPKRGLRRVYLTRRRLTAKNDSAKKKVVNNEEEVERLFAAKRFEIIAPETLPFHEQIPLIGRARHVAGVKGSALHMILFNRQPSVRLIQISRWQSVNQCIIDGIKNADAHHICCESLPRVNGSVVDLEILREALREI